MPLAPCVISHCRAENTRDPRTCVLCIHSASHSALQISAKPTSGAMRSLLAPTLVIAACSLTVQPRMTRRSLGGLLPARRVPDRRPGSRPQEGLHKRLRLELQPRRARQQGLLRGPMRGLLRPGRPQGNQRRKLGDVAITSIPVQARTACPGPSRARAARSAGRATRERATRWNTAKTSRPRWTSYQSPCCPRRYGEVRSKIHLTLGGGKLRAASRHAWVARPAASWAARAASRNCDARASCSSVAAARRVSSATDRAKVPYCSISW